MNNTSILIIDNEVHLRKLLYITLQSNNFQVHEAMTAQDGLTFVANNSPDLILLNLELGDQRGYDVLMHLREWFLNPIIIISVQDNEADIINALDNGATDYLVTPIRTGELLRKIKIALAEKKLTGNTSIVRFDDLSIDFANRIVKKAGSDIPLMSIEYALFSLFARNEGKILTHRYLLNRIWGYDNNDESQHLKVAIAQLRKKIEKDHHYPLHIVTESGIGYRFTGSIQDHVNRQ